jgi:hypothetical protein
VVQQLRDLVPDALHIEVPGFKSQAERSKYPDGSKVCVCLAPRIGSRRKPSKCEAPACTTLTVTSQCWVYVMGG